MYRISIKTKLSAVISILVLSFIAFNLLYYPRWARHQILSQAKLSALQVPEPGSYDIPQAWPEVIARLQWNGVQLERLSADRTLHGQAYRIDHAAPRPGPYEGHMFHDEVRVSLHPVTAQARAGDVLVHLDQACARYAVETLEPQAHDSFFRWGFFNAILEKKEHFSDYVFEDTALEMLRDEPELAAAFAQWKLQNPQLLADQDAVLSFIYTNGQRHEEPEWRRYPVVRVMSA